MRKLTFTSCHSTCAKARRSIPHAITTYARSWV